MVQEKTRADDEDLVDTLIAISVVAKLLAKKVRNRQDITEKGERNEQNKRNGCLCERVETLRGKANQPWYPKQTNGRR